MLISFESAAVVSRLRLWMQRLVNLLAFGQKTRALELKAQGERRGGDTSSGEQRNPVNSPECSGKETREIAAQKAGFGSEFTYRQAKTGAESATSTSTASAKWASRRMVTGFTPDANAIRAAVEIK